jgi:putative DNA primase/helicase
MATAVLMHSSVHGAGKSWFFEEVMGGIYGEYKRVFGQAEIESQYNDWVSETLFGVFEEVLSRSQKYAHGGTLKQLITGKRIRINKKFISGWEESNHMNCVFLSNEFQALYVEPSDRRFLVIWPEEKLLDELKKDIENELANGGAAYFYQWLLKTNLDGFTAHTEPPQTDAKRRLIDFGRPGWEVFYLQWKGGDTPYPYHTCLVSQLYTAYKRWCSQSGESQLALNRFSGFISSYEKRRKDVRYLIKGVEKKGAFFEIGQKADKQTQAEWFGKCAEGFEEALFKNEAPRE